MDVRYVGRVWQSTDPSYSPEIQIKNTVYTARVMAHRHETSLLMEYLESVIEATVASETEFNKTSSSDSLYN
jgi:hypothetical protein